jgi:hypothetical protein
MLIAACNFLTSTSKPHKNTETTSSEVGTVALTYGLNLLQNLPESKHGLVLLTVNPTFPVDPEKTVGKWTYDSPMMTPTSNAAQALLPSIQNTRNISYTGAWTKNGSREDGLSSGMRLVTSAPFHVRPPFPLEPATRNTDRSGIAIALSRAIVRMLERYRRRLEPAWEWVAYGVVLALVWVEQIFLAVRMNEMRNEVVRIRDCWAGGAGDKKTR